MTEEREYLAVDYGTLEARYLYNCLYGIGPEALKRLLLPKTECPCPTHPHPSFQKGKKSERRSH